MVITLTPEQEQQLIQHAAARNATLEEAFAALLDTRPPAHRPWSEDELNLLRNAKNSVKSIARATSRTPTAVSVRRNKLAVAEQRTDLLRPRKDKDTKHDDI